ncbi:MAG: tyrosine-type recombinase/integrase [Pseudomonadota bacterium]|jgi:integrase/recombinase XerD
MKISKIVSMYIFHKRALGQRFRSEEAILTSFCKVVGDGPISNVDEETVLAFLNGNGPVTVYWEKKHRVLSGLNRFAQTRGLAEGLPLPRTIPKPTIAAFVPYIYSHEELRRLLDAIPAACSGRTPIEEEILRPLLLLLYGTGLRIGEALRLTLDDVDLRQACLHIRGTKFFKSRLVPMGKDLTGVLMGYVLKRHGLQATSAGTPLFCFRNELPLSQSAVRSAFRRVRSHAGVMRYDGPRRQPRIHDLRHTAAVHRLISWYRSGKDLQDLLPKLATYLGHRDLSSTQHYLTLTPELLQEASQRFEHYAKGETHD